ncbi:MAG TPA: glycosyltransferase family 1 protein [Terriglobales bacterium]|nr:glycosyltransferase family 1 protein [Terriglobales bacterium]
MNTSHPANPTIAFDTWALGGFARHQGIHVYAHALLAHFRELSTGFSVEIAPYVFPGMDNDANAFPAGPGFRPTSTAMLKKSRLWRYGGASTLASVRKADLVFSPNCTSLYAGISPPSVVTVHDAIPALLSAHSRRVGALLRFCLWWSVHSSRAIISVSQRSKRDIVDVYGVPESKITVIYHGYDKSAFNAAPADAGLTQALLRDLGIRKPYLLHHGVIKPQKNLRRLIQAYRLLRQRNRNLDLDLVLAGPLGWEYQDVLAEATRDPGAGAVILTGALDRPRLAALVKGARLVVVPSLYEGFCLPLVESMACGVPTIAANNSCLPEISGGGLRYFDPYSLDEMAACMEEALEKNDVRNELIEKGTKRAQEFDWRRCAEQTLALLAQHARRGRG